MSVVPKSSWMLGLFAIVTVGASGRVEASRVVGGVQQVSAPFSVCVAKEAPESRPRVAALGPVALPRVAAHQVTRLEAADLTLELGRLDDGSIQIAGRGGELTIRKTVQQQGDFLLELGADSDHVILQVAPHSVRVRRAAKEVVFSPAEVTEDDLDQVRRLLADSRAIVLLRRIGAAVYAVQEDSATSAALLMADAVAGMLTGDGGAPGRVARHFARHAAGRLRRAALGTDCYSEWEQLVVRAMNEFLSCFADTLWYAPLQYLCSFRWLLQVESAWFQFLSCSSFPT